MAFLYHNQKNRYCMERLIDEMKESCEGKNLSIGKLAANKEGYYSEDKMMEFLDEFIDSAEPEYLHDNLNKEEEEIWKAQKKYNKSLLYVVIRAMQSGIGCLVGKGGEKPVTIDSFSELLRHINYCSATVFCKNQEGKRTYLLSPDLAATVNSVYYYLTGQERIFPDPYIMNRREKTSERKGATENECEGEELKKAKEEIEKQEDVCEESYEDDYLADPWEEETDEAYNASLTASYAQEAEEYYYHGDALSHADWEEDISMDEYGKQYAEWKKYHIGDLSNEKEKERFDAQARKLKIFFQNKQEFISRYDHLCEVTTAKHVKCLQNLEAMVEGWLKKKDLMLYCNEEEYRQIFDMLYAIVGEVRRFQEKKI